MDIYMGSRRRMIFLLGVMKFRLRKDYELACIKERKLCKNLTKYRNRLKYEELTAKQETRIEKIIGNIQERLLKQQQKCDGLERELILTCDHLLSLIRRYNDQMKKLLKNYMQSQSISEQYRFPLMKNESNWTITEKDNGFINIVFDEDL